MIWLASPRRILTPVTAAKTHPLRLRNILIDKVIFQICNARNLADSLLAIMIRMTAPARLLLSARMAAGITQRALARRARTSQSVIARIESGATSPSWKTLEHLLKHAGFDLQASFTMRARWHSHMLDDVARILRLTPEERLLELRNAARFFAAARRLNNGCI
jgi:transcriptional regulator with XRE-family HTH domain